MTKNTQTLFSDYPLGDLHLSNRIVMAPMTRSRAINNVPNELMSEYYGQRAAAGLIITEGTSPSPNGLGYSRIPGIFSNQQVEAWKKVTTAVHNNAGKIFLQLMHTGRVGHPLNLPTYETLVAPSAVKLTSTQMWVDGQGLLDIPVPRELTREEILKIKEDHLTAALNAMKAGFDGIELHGANGYLIKQFLNPHTNIRTDDYGGSVENRARFLLELAADIANVIGKDKVGVRISPGSEYNETPQYDEADATYLHIANELNNIGIAYLHITDPQGKGEPNDLILQIRKTFKKALILSGGYTAEKAEEVLRNNHADLISFARQFIPNPDLVTRFKNKLPLNQPKFDLFYTPGAEGYVDYPVFAEVQVV